MRYDPKTGSWSPAHEQQVQLGGSRRLLVAIAVLIIGAVAVSMLPVRQPAERQAMAARMP